MMLAILKSRPLIAAAVLALSSPAAFATAAKLDDDTCKQLRVEHEKFEQSGIMDEIAKGPEWGKANLSPDKLREIEHFFALDEQVKFGCRDAKPSRDAERASEAAGRIEMNSDADPTAPAAAGSHSKNPKKKRRSHAKADADPAPAAGPKAAKSRAGKDREKKNDAYNPPAPPVIIVQDPAKPPQTAADPN